MFISKLIAFTISVLLISFTSIKESLANENLSIKLVKPNDAMQLIAGDYWTVYLDGEIDEDAAKRLSIELKRNNVKYGIAKLNSSPLNNSQPIDLIR
jgi:hypothetical protein